MLKEIRCTLFRRGSIQFHKGLNVILGDDEAKNSIGKSTALMVIDFVQGGGSFTNDDAGAIQALGHHTYDFSFEFDKQQLYFSRSTDSPDIVNICNAEFIRLSELPIEDYRRKLKLLYGLDDLDSSFRSAVSPFSRIWKKGGLEPDHPFISMIREPSGTAISRLIDLFNFNSDIAAEKKVIEDQKERKRLISGSMNANIIPKINKTQYKANTRTITENELQIEQLKQGFSGALNAYEALFDESLRNMQQRKKELTNLKSELQIKIERLQREITGITPRLAVNISLIAEFFPTVDEDKLAQVETFHQKIGNVVKKELKAELGTAQSEFTSLSDEIALLEQQIQNALTSKGLPDDMFKRVFDLKEVTDRASEENKYFEQKEQVQEAIKTSTHRLDDIYSRIFTDIEQRINVKLKAFNKVVYGPTRNSSKLKIKNANSYVFSSPEDTGTGKSYAGLIGFDLAMLSLTNLPFVIHDSVLYKNIEIPAVRRIIRILTSIKAKQIFLSFDEAKKFGSRTEQLLNKFAVLKLNHNDILYNKDWRDQK